MCSRTLSPPIRVGKHRIISFASDRRDLLPRRRRFIIKTFVRKFVVYTEARSPSDYCKDKESPPEQLPKDQYGNITYKSFKGTNQPSTSAQPSTAADQNENRNSEHNQPPEVQQNLKRPREIDLNELPPEEDE